MKNQTEAYRYSILKISGLYFGIDVECVKEVLQLPLYTRVPNVHPSILGVFNLRGQIYSLIDIRIILKLETSALTEETFIIIIEKDNLSFAIIVDRVLDVVKVESNKIEIPTREMPLNLLHYINGLYEDKKIGMLHLLDLDSLIRSEEINTYRFAERV